LKLLLLFIAVFEPFFKDYIQAHRFQSIDTDEFKNYFITYFTKLGKADKIEDIDWDSWLYTPGMPLVVPRYDYIDTELFNSQFRHSTIIF
jgi:aminopeptidase N